MAGRVGERNLVHLGAIAQHPTCEEGVVGIRFEGENAIGDVGEGVGEEPNVCTDVDGNTAARHQFGNRRGRTYYQLRRAAEFWTNNNSRGGLLITLWKRFHALDYSAGIARARSPCSAPTRRKSEKPRKSRERKRSKRLKRQQPDGEQRSNETHSSTTDPEAKLAKKGKGKEAKLAYTGNVMTENRNGFVVEAELRQVSGMVERETAKDMIVRYSPGAKRITVGADKGFDTADFVSGMRDFNVTPHVAQNTTNRLSAIDGRTIRHCGYEVSQQKRKRVEEPFGWGKTIGGLARPMLRGVKKLDFKFTLTMAAYDLIKLP